MLKVQEFIRSNPDWEKKLTSKPYCLEVKRDNALGKNLLLLKYNQIESDFSVGIVKECRGLVLDEDTLEIVAFPFTKFFNAGEPYAAEIDWTTASVQAKLDGSIIKIVKLGDELLIGTNANIDAFKAPLAEQVGCAAKTFGDLVLQGAAYYGLDKGKLASLLEHNKTYIFELTSPYNQVVVRWKDTKISLIGIRDNVTGAEEKYELSPLAKTFDTPKIYPIKSLEQCIAETAKMGDDEEGYVVRDDNFNRIKVKSPNYLRLHRLAGNGILTFERAVDIVKANEIEEISAYFPNFKAQLDSVKKAYDNLVLELELEWVMFLNNNLLMSSRKEQAAWISEHFIIPGIGFLLLDKKYVSVRDCLGTMPAKRIRQHLEA